MTPAYEPGAIGERIRRARLAADITQADLAEAIGLSRPSIANAETGNQNLTVAALFAIAGRLNVSVAALIGEVELKLPPRVKVTADGWVIRCDECGLIGPSPTKAAGEVIRDEHLATKHGATS